MHIPPSQRRSTRVVDERRPTANLAEHHEEDRPPRGRRRWVLPEVEDWAPRPSYALKRGCTPNSWTAGPRPEWTTRDRDEGEPEAVTAPTPPSTIGSST